MLDTVRSIVDQCAAALHAALEGIGREDLDWKPAQDSRSIGEIARHVIRVDNMFIRRLGQEPRVDDPGASDARVILEALRAQRAQLEEIIAGLDDGALARAAHADAKPGETLGGILLHMAQHHLYHVAQIVYLRRARDREWPAPLGAWEDATHRIGDAILGS